MMKKKTYIIGLLLALLLVVGCAPSGGEPGAAPDATDTPTEEATDVPESEPTDEAETPDEVGGGEAGGNEAALEAAVAALEQQLGLNVADIEVQSVEETEWPNACLGLPEDDEVCAEVITPGYLVIVDADGRVYEVRTDLQGEIVRYLETADPGQELPAAAVRAREVLADDLGIDLESIEVDTFERREWSDSCLGLGGPAESCLQVITPGWLVVLSVDGQTYEVHTDEEGEQVRIAEQVKMGEDMENQPIVVLSQSGGIAGQVIEWRIYADGRVEKVEDLQNPQAEGNVQSAQVDPQEVDELIAGLEELGYFDLDGSYLPGDTCCDRFMYNLTVQTQDRMHAIAALDGTDDVPEEVWESIEAVQNFVEESLATE